MKKIILTLFIIHCLFIIANAQNRGVNSFVSQEQTVNGFSNTYLGYNQAEPFIATNPRDPLNTICAFIYGGYFTIDGLNWTSINSLNSFDPYLTFDSLGNAYYTPSPPWGNNYSVRKSTDKGATWPYNYLIYSGSTDKPCICANQSGGSYSNYLYTAWQLYGTGVSFSRSLNQGVTWSSPLLISPEISYCPYLAIGPSSTTPGGIIYYGYNSYLSDTSLDNFYIKIRKSTDAGISFSNNILVSTFTHPIKIKNNTLEINACIQMAADNSYGPYRGNVYIVYTAKGTGNDICDIFFTKSTNYGDNWSTPIKLNDDNTYNDQWMPALSVDKYGRIYIVWYDSRIDPQNYMTLLYGTVSTDGGASFFPDFPVSLHLFNPASGINTWLGHYIGVSAIGNTAIAAWYEWRDGYFKSYTGYFPDFAMTINPDTAFVGSNDSLIMKIKIPAIKGPYIGNTKFTYSIDTLPPQGNISFNFINKDSITTIPDSVYLKIKLTNVTVPKKHRLTLTGRNTGNGVPIHSRYIDLMVNYYSLKIGTNKNLAQYKVDGITYSDPQNLILPVGIHIVQAISPYNLNNNSRYVFLNWSDEGDTTHSIVLSTNTTLTANYKTQFKFILSSSVGNSFGGNDYYDSAQVFNFGVLSKMYYYNGQMYKFTGWNGLGVGSYTSPDSTGNDTTVTWSMNNTIVEVARWILVTGIRQISSEIPKEFKLYYAYPNPYNPATNIQFSLPKNTDVKLEVFDITGRRISELINKHMEAGTYKTTFEASMFASGVYFYRLTADGFTDIKKMVLLK
jgi:hypothetical protein